MRSQLRFLQTELRTGFKSQLTTEVAEIGTTLADLIRTALPDLTATDKDEDTIVRSRTQVSLNIHAQLHEWARGASFPAQSLSKLAPDDSLPPLPLTIPNAAHRALVGALAFFTSLPTNTPLAMVAPVFCSILFEIIEQQWDTDPITKPH